MATIDEIKDNFELLDEWEDRYRYVIELGKSLAPLPAHERIPDNKVQGCASQVWLARSVKKNESGEPVLTFVGDSDAIIVRGLIAILLAIYSGQTANNILDVNAIETFDELGFREHLSPQRSNGLRSMVQRVRRDAEDARQGSLT